MTPCPKRGFTSSDAAKRAHRRAGFRLRTYRCPDCGRWHVTANEKGYNAKTDRYRDA